MAQNFQAVVLNQDQLDQLIAAAAGGAAAPDGGRKRLTVFASGEPTEWRTWRRNFETISIINGWNDIRQRREAAAAMEGAAALAIQDIDHENEPNIDHQLNEYENRFIPQAAGRLARAEFYESSQKATETIIQWHTRLRELFSRAYPARNVANDEQIIDQFVNNLLDSNIQSHVLDAAPNTYAAALDAAQSKMANQLILTKTTGKGMHNVTKNIERTGIHYAQPTKDRRNDVKCWYCRREGHPRHECKDFIEGKTYFTAYFKNQQNRNSGKAQRKGQSNWRRDPTTQMNNISDSANQGN